MHGASFSTLFSPEIQLAPWKLPEITWLSWEGIPSSGFFFWASMKGWENAHALSRLVLVLQQVLLSVYSSFRFPLMKAEQWHCILHRQHDSIRVYDLKKFQRLIHVKLKAVSCYNITWIYSCSFNIGFGWYNTRISHSFVKN